MMILICIVWVMLLKFEVIELEKRERDMGWPEYDEKCGDCEHFIPATGLDNGDDDDDVM